MPLHLALLHTFWGLNSGSHAFKTSTLLTELSSQTNPTHFYDAVIKPIPTFSLRLGILENLTLWVLNIKHVGYIIPWLEGWMGKSMHAYVYV